MNEGLWGFFARDRYAERLREAEAARLAARAAREQGAGLRRRLGRALVRLGNALAEPEAVQPANGH